MSLLTQTDYPGHYGFPYWDLYYWLGPTQIPPLTMNIGLTDRANGLVWYMFVTNDGKHITFTTTKAAGPVKVYGAWDGPFVGQDGYRMGIKSGHVVIDYFNGEGAGPFARGLSNILVAAVLFTQNTSGSRIAGPDDHLAFQSDNVKGGIFDPTP